MDPEARRSTSADLARFAIVGGVGFVIDAGILTALVSWSGFNVYAARAGSFATAVLATWALNRQWVFGSVKATRARAVGAEYLRYVLVQGAGALTNLAVFAVVLALVPDWLKYPVIPLAIGAVAGLLINFAGAKLWVFPSRDARPEVP